MPENITEICAVLVLADCNQIEVRYLKDDNVCHYRVYEQWMKDDLIADLENPAYGGQSGDAAPHLAQLGW